MSWQAVAAPTIPATAGIGAIAERPGPDRLLVAVGVWDWGAASASAGGDAHLGAAWTSTDGVAWSKAVHIDTARMLWDVAYGESRFVAVGAFTGKPSSGGVMLAAMAGGDAPGVWTSSDGMRWKAAKLRSGASLVQVAFGDAGFVAVGSDPACSQGCDELSTTPLYRSSDGSSWVMTGTIAGYVADLAAAPGRGYAAIVRDLDGCSRIWHSRDGLGWAETPSPDSRCLSGEWLLATGAGFAQIGLDYAEDDTATVSLSSSNDGLTWTSPVAVASGIGLPEAAGLLSDIIVIAGMEGIWELLPGEAGTRRPEDPASSFGAFGGGVGLRVTEQGGVAILPTSLP